MKAKLFTGLRILLGVFVIVFGVNKFSNFLPPFELSDAAAAYFNALVTAKTIMLVGVVEILVGIALILNKYGALAAIVLMSVSVNAVLYHAVLDPVNIAGALVLLLLNIAVLWTYKSNYKSLLS